jgi:hypothetical protein|uniref:Uncharacterized protein n=1 Tax=viral metagenome TaxID=1070528 RepID=A0A6C0K015_9ZZZZ
MEQPYASDPQTRRQKIHCKPELIIASLQRFYATYPDMTKVMPYLVGDAEISLRVIDWFVTKFSRKNFTSYELNGQRFVVYKSYKGQLDAYNKQYFDTNCRRERIQFSIKDYEPFITTIGKLNFFRWALETHLLDYIESNKEELKAGYNQFLKETTQAHKSSTPVSTTSEISTVSAETLALAPPKGTRRRRTKQQASSLKQLQINTENFVELSFD